MLNAKQEAFCLHYAKTGNATESYKIAYNAKNDNSAGVGANRMLKNSKIQKRLQEIADEIKGPKIADVTEMQEILTRIMRQEQREEVVTKSGGIVLKRPSNDDAIKAITQLAKMQGVAENVNINVSIPVIAGDEELED